MLVMKSSPVPWFWKIWDPWFHVRGREVRFKDELARYRGGIWDMVKERMKLNEESSKE